MLCGIAVPHDQGLDGHSDADVGLHALTDAILGAIGAGDIGQHFPPSDPRWRGADSGALPRPCRAAASPRAAAGSLIARRHASSASGRRSVRIATRWCARIAAILGIDPSRVSVKATTTEGLGFTGRARGHRGPGDGDGRFVTAGRSARTKIPQPCSSAIARRGVASSRRNPAPAAWWRHG